MNNNILVLLGQTYYVFQVQSSDFNMTVTFIRKAINDFVYNENVVSPHDKQMFHSVFQNLIQQNIVFDYIVIDTVLNKGE